MLERVIIFSSPSNQIKAKEKFYDLIDSIELDEEEVIITRSRREFKTNKRTVTIVSVNETARGHRCNTAYIDRDVPLWAYVEIIKPCSGVDSQEFLF